MGRGQDCSLKQDAGFTASLEGIQSLNLLLENLSAAQHDIRDWRAPSKEFQVLVPVNKGLNGDTAVAEQGPFIRKTYTSNGGSCLGQKEEVSQFNCLAEG